MKIAFVSIKIIIEIFFTLINAMAFFEIDEIAFENVIKYGQLLKIRGLCCAIANFLMFISTIILMLQLLTIYLN